MFLSLLTGISVAIWQAVEARNYNTFTVMLGGTGVLLICILLAITLSFLNRRKTPNSPLATTTHPGLQKFALAGTDVGAYPKFLAIGLKPGAHATASNDAYVYAVWLEYTRKA